MIGRSQLISLADREVADINQFLTTCNLPPLESPHVCVYYKAKIRGCTFYTKENSRVKKQNSYTASFLSGSESHSYCLIERFVVCNGEQLALVKEISIRCRGPINGVPLSIATASSQEVLFEDYITYEEEGLLKYIFAHQIRDKYCNLSNSEWALLTPIINHVEVE